MAAETPRVAARPDELEAAMALRIAVFVGEQGVPLDLERDEHDDEAVHWIVQDASGEVIGTARLLAYEPPGTGKIGRVAVRRDRRGRGLGAALVRAAEAWAFARGDTRVILDAQSHLRDFYERLGYTVVSDLFLDAGIPHLRMARGATEPKTG